MLRRKTGELHVPIEPVARYASSWTFLFKWFDSTSLWKRNVAIDDRVAAGKKSFKRDDDDPTPPTKEVKVSTVDPDAGFMARDNKPTGFFYLDHRTVDSVHALIVDTHVTPGNAHDNQPYLARLDIRAVGLDAGYFTPQVCKGILDRELFGVIGYKRPNHREGYFYKRDYHYDLEQNSYRCPADDRLSYRTTNQGHREYASNLARYADCALPEPVTKELHGHRYARFRGLPKVQAQCLLSAACQNMRKMALLLVRKGDALLAKILQQTVFAAPSVRHRRQTQCAHLHFRIRPVSA